MLKISEDLSLPTTAVTHTHGLLAMRGAGKSNAAVVLAEAMYDAQLPWVAVDPKGDWWGIRYADAKKGEGLSVPIFGGLHGDMPLEPGSGSFMAALVVDRRLTCVLDLSEMSKGEQIKFLVDFARRLFALKNQHRFPMHLFLDEADDYIPQRIPSGRGEGPISECVGLFSRIVKQGRNRGIGVTMATQRSAVLNKDVLTQLDTLIAMRTTAKLDRDAIRGWVEYHAVAKELVDSLPEMEDGDGWVWSPHAYKVMKKVHFLRRRTFDSGATPEVGEDLEPSGRLSDVDIAAIKEQMTETIERAKADDPKELRRRISELERQLRDRPEQAAVEVERIVEVEKVYHRLSDTDLEEFSQRLVGVYSIQDSLMSMAEGLRAFLEEQKVKAAKGLAEVRKPLSLPKPMPVPKSLPFSKSFIDSDQAQQLETDDLFALSKGARGLLDVLVSVHPRKVTRSAWATIAGRSIRSSSFVPHIAELVDGGWIERDGDLISDRTYLASGKALSILGDSVTAMDATQVRERWLRVLPSNARKLLVELIESYPVPLTKEELAIEAGISLTSSGLGDGIKVLRQNNLAVLVDAGYLASESLW